VIDMGGKPRAKTIPLRGANGEPLVVAMPKGRIFEEAAALFAAAGRPVAGPGRVAQAGFDCGALRLLVLRSGDVDLRRVRRRRRRHRRLDVPRSMVRLYQPLDLGIGARRPCRRAG
jgi:hypothetical protein